MNGFSAFRGEHNLPEEEILNITVIDDEKSLERLDYYRAYPYVTKTVSADVFDIASNRSNQLVLALSQHRRFPPVLGAYYQKNAPPHSQHFFAHLLQYRLGYG